jgi:phage tail-like protein
VTLPASNSLLGGDIPVAVAFLIEVEGIEIGVFLEVRGLEVGMDPLPVVEGGQNEYVHKLPNRLTWPDITLKRGLTQSDALFEWMSQSSGDGFTRNGNKVVRRNGSIVALPYPADPNRRLRSWNVYDMMPIRWKGPEFAVDKRDLMVEELTITHHGFIPSTH